MSRNTFFLASNNDCTGCGACASSCPKGCIVMTEDREGFLQPKVNKHNCVECHLCEKACPIVSPNAKDDTYHTEAFAAINRNDEIRKCSSSGGVFYEFARKTIEDGGVVFGARFNENWEVVHSCAKTLPEIVPLMRSKYVQSSIGDTYKEAKEYLKAGVKVLFVGTPCQIEGLYSFLGRKCPNLLTIDIICHGVPSPKVWKQYLRETVKGEAIVNVNFRDKGEGWANSQMMTISTPSTSFKCNQLENIFFRGFIRNAYLRRSCGDCHFRNYHRVSDLTIADYWGVDKYCPQMYDNKGTSLVFCHTQLGRESLLKIESKFHLLPQGKESAIACNGCMVSQNPASDKRIRFFRLFTVGSFRLASYVIDHDSPKVRIKKILNRFLFTL